jgi:hypothetical protein
MMSTRTSAIALTMAGILGDSGYTADQIPQAVFTLTLLAGLTGVSDASRATLARTGMLPLIGEANVLPLGPTLGGALELGFGRGRQLWSELGPRGASAAG